MNFYDLTSSKKKNIYIYDIANELSQVHNILYRVYNHYSNLISIIECQTNNEIGINANLYYKEKNVHSTFYLFFFFFKCRSKL